jgi:hypothetical protein
MVRFYAPYLYLPTPSSVSKTVGDILRYATLRYATLRYATLRYAAAKGCVVGGSPLLLPVELLIACPIILNDLLHVS